MARQFPPILMYHSVSDPSLPHAVDRELFARQMALLAARGLRGTSVSSALEHPREDTIVLTLDDGYADNLTTALPVLQRHGFSATVFVVADFAEAGATPYQHAALTWEQCRELQDAGIEIGSHSYSHPDLRKLSDAELAREIADAKGRIEDRLGTAVRSFAYPFGYLDRHVVDVVRQAGYDSACAVRLARGFPEDLLTLQRVGITRNDTMLRFRLKLSPPYRRLLDARLADLVNRVS